MCKKNIRNLICSLLITSSFIGNTYINVKAIPSLDNVSNEEKLEILDNEITSSMDKIKNLSEEIDTLTKKIDQNEKKIVDIKKSYISQKDFLNNSFKANNNMTTNKNNTLNLFEVIFSSNSFYDLLQNIQLSKNLNTISNSSLNNLNKKEVLLNTLIENLDKDKKDLENLKQDSIKEKEDMEKNKKLVLEEIEKERKAKEEAQMQAQNLSISDSTTYVRNPNYSEIANNLIEEAYKYLGTPYVWGGTTPSGFDCSGFMQYIFAKNNISLPRVSESQQLCGKKVSYEELEPGDLVFWGYPAHHVGMYIGNGKYIHSPHTGDVIKISNLSNNISSASRLF